MVDLIKVAEEAFATQQERPTFKAGDTITVAYKIVEGSKERIQLYRGVVIKIKGHGDKSAGRRAGKLTASTAAFAFLAATGLAVND